MKQDYAINADFNIGNTETSNKLKLNGVEIAGGGGEYTAGDGIDITNKVISIADGGVTADKIAPDAITVDKIDQRSHHSKYFKY